MLKQRVLTAIVLLIALVMITTLLSPFLFALVIAGILMIAGLEWTRFIGLENARGRVSYLFSLLSIIAGLVLVLGITPTAATLDPARVNVILGLGMLFWLIAIALLSGYPGNAVYWNDPSRIALMGLLALVPAWTGLVQLKYLEPGGYLVLMTIALVSVADIGAYFAGRAFGNRKLAPAISPNKSWAGVWGGMAATMSLAVLFVWIAHTRFVTLTPAQAAFLVACSIPLALISVAGDLFESMLKRNRDLKDSGSILPGHGGIMDRIDSLVAVVPLVVLTLTLVARSLPS